MERHLAECEDCRRLLAGLRAVVDGLHRLPTPGGGLDAVQIAAAGARAVGRAAAGLTEPLCGLRGSNKA